MANVSDFAFFGMSRIGNDNCDLSQRNTQNSKKADYLLTNYQTDDCLMKKPMDSALT